MRAAARRHVQRFGAVVGNGHVVAAHFQQHRQAVGGIAVVVDQQDALCLQHHAGTAAGCGAARRLHRGGCLRHRQRQPQREGAAHARPGAGRGNSAAMQFHQRAAQRQADAQPAMRIGAGAAFLHEHVEDVFQRLRRNAAALVDHLYQKGTFLDGGDDADGRLRRRELRRVQDQVLHHLHQPDLVGVHRDRCGVGLHRDVLRLGLERRPCRLGGERDHFFELQRPGAQLDAPGVDAADVEQVVDQPAQVRDLAFDQAQAPVGQRRVAGRQPHRRQRAVHRRQRVAQLVRQRGQEFAHALARALQLLVAAALAHVAGDLGKAPQRA
ncbi:hypothetical protein D9M68_406510 [compost metagenome]